VSTTEKTQHLSARGRPAPSIEQLVADELGVEVWRVRAAIGLLDGGATVPFIARYRKEATGTLDDAQLRDLEERLRYLRELEDRRATVLQAIEDQGMLTPELRTAVVRASTKSELEDLYLPYKSKRRTKAQLAREAGLEPLADALLKDGGLDPEAAAGGYVGAGFETAADVLAGARAILTERVGQDAALVSELRERVWTRGRLRSKASTASKTSTAKAGPGPAKTPKPPVDASKFSDYVDFVQAPDRLPSHRVLALLRGERDGALALEIAEADPRDEESLAAARSRCEAAVARSLGVRGPAEGPGAEWMSQTVRLAWRGRLLARIESDLRTRLFEAAQDEAIRVFAANLRDVLLAAPAGNRAVLGLDPGLRTGVKVAVVNGTGKVVDTATIYPHAPAKRWDESLATLEALAVRHSTRLVAVGNGTASRETDKLAGELLARLAKNPALEPAGTAAASAEPPAKVIVSEAGASVYSASALASAELPELDVSLRGAVSIARRLQDPLAELVKIEPKSIGVGQYQHDLAAAKLDRSLDAVVEDCVNAVGVDVNTASPALLARVAGVGETLSRNIVDYRDANGPFSSRADLKKVPRLGAKAFEQCAGFLRITGGRNRLDASAVHPEAYGLAQRMLAAAGVATASVGVDAAGLLARLDPSGFVDEKFGLPTVKDVLAELARPGRDPRPGFVTASLKDGIEKIGDLVPGMILEGTVSNVAAFGAFVDIGVHQDGLVHVSALSNGFVSDPREVVRSGQVVKVKVLEVDEARKRIALTLRLDDEAGGARGTRSDPRGGSRRDTPQSGPRNDAGRSRGGEAPASGRAPGDKAPRPDVVPGGNGQNRAKTPPAPANTPQNNRGRSPRTGAPAAPSAAPSADTALADALRRAGLA
jgi:uncharacterized protein